MPKNDARPTRLTWQNQILSHIRTNPSRPLKLRGLARAIGIEDRSYPDFRTLVREMIDNGGLVLGPGRTLMLPRAVGGIVGVFRANRRGFGFISREDEPGAPDVYVSPLNTGGALDGDRVAARLLRERRRGEPEAEITRILKRSERNWVGVLERSGGDWIVRPQGKGAPPLVQIEDPTARSARAGDLVVVEPIERSLGMERLRGVIVEKLGTPGETQAKVLAVTRRFALPAIFPADVRAEARHAAETFDAERAAAKREDLRDLLTITIDPTDARDFDDAISIMHLPDGRVQLGVHIADVAHFVRAETALDREARLRGNSVYFPGHVVPMLPEVLSNGLCSLQPLQPRLTKTAFITFDRNAKPVEARITNSIIRSAARLTYDQVTAALERDEVGDLEPAVLQLLKDAERLARRIRQRRLKDGMIVLALPELEIELNEDGRVIGAGPADTSFSHTLIEMFMVEANEAVSRYFKSHGLPHLRRIHPEPAAEKSVALSNLAHLLDRPAPKVLDRETIQQLLSAAKGRPEEMAVSYVILRSLAQASYSPSEEGHFALASQDYCHFTSPIRRYPDLAIHRLLDLVLMEGRAALDEDQVLEEMVELGRHTSSTERRAQQAERELKTWLLIELMKEKVGEKVSGVITGVTQYGVFVQIQPYMAEGILRVDDFPGDEWEFDRTREMFFGRFTGRVVAFGQPVQVRIAAVDEVRLEVGLVPIEGAVLGASLRKSFSPGAGARQGSRGQGSRAQGSRGRTARKPKSVSVRKISHKGARKTAGRNPGGGRRKRGRR